MKNIFEWLPRQEKLNWILNASCIFSEHSHSNTYILPNFITNTFTVKYIVKNSFIYPQIHLQYTVHTHTHQHHRHSCLVSNYCSRKHISIEFCCLHNWPLKKHTHSIHYVMCFPWNIKENEGKITKAKIEWICLEFRQTIEHTQSVYAHSNVCSFLVAVFHERMTRVRFWLGFY